MRAWLVIPAAGIVAGGAGELLGVTPLVGLAGAALAAAIRALAGESPATLAAACAAPLLAVAALADQGDAAVRAVLAIAMAAWTFAELARPSKLPFGALGPALAAAVLDPAFVALVLIAGAHLVRGAERPRWALVTPLVGGAVIGLAVLAGTVWPALGDRWFAAPAHPIGVPQLAMLGALAIGPVFAVAAVAGAALVLRAREAEIAVATACAGAILVDLRAGTIGPATLALAALLAGLAIGRLAAMIRIPSGQAITAATIGALLVAPPAWTTLERTGSHTQQASR